MQDAANGMKLYQYTRINYAAKEKGMYSYWRDWFTKAGGLSPKRVGQVRTTLMPI